MNLLSENTNRKRDYTTQIFRSTIITARQAKATVALVFELLEKGALE